MQYAMHPASSVLPRLSESEATDLVRSLQDGEREPVIVLYEDQVIESPGTLEAFEEAGVPWKFSAIDLNGQGPTEFAIVHAVQKREALTAGQRSYLALWLLPQYDEPDRSGRPGIGTLGLRYPMSGESVVRAAKLTGAGISAVQTALRIQKLDPEMLDHLRTGKFSISKAARMLGLARGFHSNSPGHVEEATVDAMGRSIPTYYGKGDKWKEATSPLLRYLNSWGKREYKFSHVNPREARKRLMVIEELQAKLSEVKADLELRSHSATLTISQKGK